MKSRLEWYIGMAAALGLATGLHFSDPHFMPLVLVALFLMLWPAMLDMELSGLRSMFKRPRGLLLSFLLNFLVSPLLIYVLSRLFLSDVPPGMVIGVLLFGLMPCGGMSPAYTGMLQGNVGLAVSIAAVSLLLSIGIVPLWTELLIGRLVAVPTSLAAQSMAISIFLPLLFAWFTRKVITWTRGDEAFQRLKPSLKQISPYGLMLLAFAIFAMNGRQAVQDPLLMLRITLASLFFLTSLLAVSLFLGRMSGLGHADISALAISSATKNNAISLTLALLMFDAQAALAIAVAGPMVQIPVMLGFQRWYRSKKMYPLSPLSRL
jgi:ACR3 family arsenite efflux pump ArsB